MEPLQLQQQPILLKLIFPSLRYRFVMELPVSVYDALGTADSAPPAMQLRPTSPLEMNSSIACNITTEGNTIGPSNAISALESGAKGEQSTVWSITMVWGCSIQRRFRADLLHCFRQLRYDEVKASFNTRWILFQDVDGKERPDWR